MTVGDLWPVAVGLTSGLLLAAASWLAYRHRTREERRRRRDLVRRLHTRFRSAHSAGQITDAELAEINVLLDRLARG